MFEQAITRKKENIMNKEELVKEIAKKSGVSQKAASDIL